MELEEFILPSLFVVLALTLLALRSPIIGFMLFPGIIDVKLINISLSMLATILIGIAYLLIRSRKISK